MFTQVKGNKVEPFDINITSVDKQQFEFEVVDSKLLSATGGVIQGMSGSPIVQNDLFIGAVTHMFVENPKNGVGLSIVEMLKKSKR